MQIKLKMEENDKKLDKEIEIKLKVFEEKTKHIEEKVVSNI